MACHVNQPSRVCLTALHQPGDQPLAQGQRREIDPALLRTDPHPLRAVARCLEVARRQPVLDRLQVVVPRLSVTPPPTGRGAMNLRRHRAATMNLGGRPTVNQPATAAKFLDLGQQGPPLEQRHRAETSWQFPDQPRRPRDDLERILRDTAPIHRHCHQESLGLRIERRQQRVEQHIAGRQPRRQAQPLIRCHGLLRRQHDAPVFHCEALDPGLDLREHRAPAAGLRPQQRVGELQHPWMTPQHLERRLEGGRRERAKPLKAPDQLPYTCGGERSDLEGSHRHTLGKQLLHPIPAGQ